MRLTPFRILGSRLRTVVLAGTLAAGTLLVGADAQAQPAAIGDNLSSQASTFTSGIQVQNLSSTTAATVTINYYDPTGTPPSPGMDSAVIPAGGSHTFFPISAPAGFNGGAVVSADQPVAAVVNLLGSTPTLTESYDGVATATTTAYVPLFQQNNGTPATNTSLYIENASATAQTVTASFFSGNSLISNPPFTIPANGTQLVNASNDGLPAGQKFVGSVVVNGPQSVAVEVSQTNGQVLFSTTGSSAGGPTVYMPLLENNNSNWYTGLQIQNIGTQATTITLTLTGSKTGQTSTITTGPIQPGASYNLFPTVIPGGDKVGSAVATSTNAQPLLGIVNQLNSANQPPQGMAYQAANGGTQTVNMPLIQYQNSSGMIVTGEQIENVGSCADVVSLTVTARVSGAQTTYKSPTPIQPGASFTFFPTVIPSGEHVGSAVATTTQACAPIVGVVDQIYGVPASDGSSSSAYEGFNQ